MMIRAKGYAIYKNILGKALTLLMNALLKSVVTDYKIWDATVVLTMRVNNGSITKREAKITIRDSLPKSNPPEDYDSDTTFIDRPDLSITMDSGEFDTVIHTIGDLDDEKK